MSRVCIAPLVVFLLHVNGNAQDHWAIDIGGLGADQVADVQVDASGDLFATGEFSATMTMGGQTFQSVGQRDVFVGRWEPDGTLDWLVTGGGNAIDRGTKVFPAADGSVLVCGQFMGAATLFDTLVYSAQGTPDVYVARLDGATGQRIWLNTAGSTAGGERPYGITASPTGQVTIAGDFKGTMWFDNTSITSLPDPITLQPGYDVFIASYAADGALLWVKHGGAKYTDRAIDLVTDPAGSIYVTGQFSDTITFDLQHPNSMYNATFLVKFSATGQEQWFVRYGGALFTHVRDLLRAPNGDLLLCGDVRGDQFYVDDVPDLVQTDGSYAYYLLRTDPNGQLLASSSMGSDHPLSVSGMALQGDSLAVSGTFDCAFTGMQDLYGSGLFTATGTEDLFIARHAASDLVLTNAQQFGGQDAKRSGPLAWTTEGDLVFCGAFSDHLVFPSDGQTWPGTDVAASANDTLGGYCGDPHYGDFVDMEAEGQLDGFLARAYVLGRAPYDFWQRGSDGACEHDARTPCIMANNLVGCADSVSICYPPVPGSFPSMLSMDMFAQWSQAGVVHPPHNGPALHFLWSTGETTPTIIPTTTGWYTCTVSTPGGCPLGMDSIHVTILPYPTVLLSDGLGINVDVALFQGVPIQICGPPVPIWPSTLIGVDSLQWYVDGVPVPGDTVWADTTAFYTVQVLNAGGCSAVNSLPAVYGGTLDLPDLSDAEFRFYYQGQPMEQDSAVLCDLVGCAQGTLAITWYENNIPVDLPEGTAINVNTDAGCAPGTVYTTDSVSWSVGAFADGWIPFTVTVVVSNAPCGTDQYLFTASDSIYITRVSLPSFDPPMDQVLCQGDTVALFLTDCISCDSVHWSGSDLIGAFGSPDTALVDLPGIFFYQAIHYDLGIGCVWPFPAPGLVFVDTPFPPSVAMQPPDGMVCPGDTVLLSVAGQGTAFQWYGPDGPIPGNSSSIAVQVPGEYGVDLINSDGCTVSSASVMMGNYGTPYLGTGLDDNILCAGESVVVDVVAPAATSIQWLPPLSGNGLSQLIVAPGNYTCAITSCGVNTFASITILQGAATAQVLEPGPFTLCPGDTALLEGLPGQAFYLWEPVAVPSQFLQTTEAGGYTLIVVDDLGCIDTSDVVIVDLTPFTQPLVAPDLSACAGEVIEVTAQGSGDLTWYADPNGTQIIGTGNDLTVGPMMADTSYFVTQTEGACTSPAAAVMVTVHAIPDPPQLDGPWQACVGGSITMNADGPADAEYHWTSPIGPFNGTSITPGPLDATGSGTWSCVAEWDGCASDTAVSVLSVSAGAIWDFDPVTPCSGAIYSLTLPGLTDVGWSNGALGNELTVSATGVYSFQATDSMGCMASGSVQVTFGPCELIVPNVFSPNGDGNNDIIALDAPDGATLHLSIFNRWGERVLDRSAVHVDWDGRSGMSGERLVEGTYFYTLDMIGADGEVRSQTGTILLLR
ncbi:MAG: gliding motility-associated C-terminal domain-containing protein [Flavobacteriales bacterium]|nr:gliding motility-associated C-terminal domain-containing protein [Flavobacteriales bacterium]